MTVACVGWWLLSTMAAGFGNLSRPTRGGLWLLLVIASTPMWMVPLGATIEHFVIT